MKAAEKDAGELTGLVRLMWTKETEEELAQIILADIRREDAAVFAEKQGGCFVGAALCSLRHDYVEGCETSPVGYLEGVVVKESCRRQGVAKWLVAACEQWAREKGCREFASDCELDNTASLAFHLQIGFQEQNRIVCFKKNL